MNDIDDIGRSLVNYKIDWWHCCAPLSGRPFHSGKNRDERYVFRVSWLGSPVFPLQ